MSRNFVSFYFEPFLRRLKGSVNQPTGCLVSCAQLDAPTKMLHTSCWYRKIHRKLVFGQNGQILAQVSILLVSSGQYYHELRAWPRQMAIVTNWSGIVHGVSAPQTTF
jgi:hypothetical protein